MEANASPLGRFEIKRAVAAAQSKYGQGDAAAAVDALAPVLQDIGRAVAQRVVHPLWSSEDWESLGPALIKHWRLAIKDWAAENFEGELPGRRAIRKVAEGLVADEVGQALIDPYAVYRGVAVRHFLRSVSHQVFGRHSHHIIDIEEATAAVVEAIWVQEILDNGVPKGLFTGFTWVPGWDGESLDAALETLTLQSVRYRSGQLEHLLPCQGMKNLLASVGQHPTLVMNYVRQKYPSDVAARFADVLEASNCLPQTLDEPALSAKDLVSIIENGGSTMALPVVYAEVNVRALLALDPRHPIELSLDNGKGHCRGLHDPVNGSGYVDIFKGVAVMPPLSLGFAGEQQLGYDIHATYGWVRSFLRCTPRSLIKDTQPCAVA